MSHIRQISSHEPVSQPQQPAPQVLLSGQATDKTKLYTRQAVTVERPSGGDLASSAPFQSFGAAAVVQGVEDASPRFAWDPAQKASLNSTQVK